MKMNNKNEVQHKSFQIYQILVFDVLMVESPFLKKKHEINFNDSK
jgi:hypothetical protein